MREFCEDLKYIYFIVSACNREFLVGGRGREVVTDVGRGGRSMAAEGEEVVLVCGASHVAKRLVRGVSIVRLLQAGARFVHRGLVGGVRQFSLSPLELRGVQVRVAPRYGSNASQNEHGQQASDQHGAMLCLCIQCHCHQRTSHSRRSAHRQQDALHELLVAAWQQSAVEGGAYNAAKDELHVEQHQRCLQLKSSQTAGGGTTRRRTFWTVSLVPNARGSGFTLRLQECGFF
jgi:hypothetical protein